MELMQFFREIYSKFFYKADYKRDLYLYHAA